MKHLKWLIFIILIITVNFTAFALNLDVDSDLSDFAQENLLTESETQNLKNPFFIKLEVEEVPAEEEIVEAKDVETQPQTEAAAPVDNRMERIVMPEPEPEIIINGVISASNSRIALLVNYQQNNHLLEIGDSIDSYELTAYKDGEATFIKNGREIKVSY
jgi:hypothetical protein